MDKAHFWGCVLAQFGVSLSVYLAAFLGFARLRPYYHRDVGADTLSRPGYTATRAVASTAAEALARSRANSRLWLTVNATNNRAIAFYDRKGYAKVGTAYFVRGTER